MNHHIVRACNYMLIEVWNMLIYIQRICGPHDAYGLNVNVLTVGYSIEVVEVDDNVCIVMNDCLIDQYVVDDPFLSFSLLA